MLTLKQINEISFRKSSFSGYKPEDVDKFIDEVSESFTALLKENQAYKAKASDLAAKNAEMREKLVVLAEKVDSYRSDEEGIKNALLSAQKLGAASIKEAKKKAEEIVAEANENAEKILEEARQRSTAVVEDYELKIQAKEREFDELKAQVTQFRSSLYNLYREHFTVIDKIPDYAEELQRKEAEAQQKKAEAQPEPPAQEPASEPAPEPAPEPLGVIPEDPEDDFQVPVPEITREDDEIDLVPEEEEELVETEPMADLDDGFGGIDLSAYTDIPESLKREKDSRYSTLEFGDGIDIRKK